MSGSYRVAPVNRGASQQGYVLLTCLLAMLFCSIVVASMLTVAGSTVNIEESGRVRERQQRAAEGGIEAVLNQVRNSATIAATSDPRLKQGTSTYNAATAVYEAGPYVCNGLSVPADFGFIPAKDDRIQEPKVAGDQCYDGKYDPNSECNPAPKLVPVDGISVRIGCTNQGPSANADGFNIPTDDGGVAVRLVGSSDYLGDTLDASDKARNWIQDLFNSVPGYTANEVAAEKQGTEEQLISSGARPLKIIGGLEVKKQIVAISSNATGPAVIVQGTAATGGKGMFGVAGVQEGCGISAIGDVNDPNNKSDVAVDSFFDSTDSGLVCEVTSVKDLASAGLPLGSGEWDNNRVQTQSLRSGQLFPNGLPADCNLADPDNNNVIYLEGSFNSNDSATLNSWWSDAADQYPGKPGAACDGKTYLFGGDVWFDVNDPTLPESDPRSHSLVFANYKSNWVFGSPNGWGNGYDASLTRPPLDFFPEKSVTQAACNRKAPTVNGSSGTNITLSSRTGWYHKAGRLVVCGPIVKDQVVAGFIIPSSHTTAIGQRPANSLGVRLLPTTFTPNGWVGSGSPTDLQVADQSGLSYTSTVSKACWDTGTCAIELPVVTASKFGNGAPNPTWPGNGKIGKVFLDVSGNYDEVLGNGVQRSIRFDVTLGGNSGSCYMKYRPSDNVSSGLPIGWGRVEYDLTNTSVEGDCDTKIAQLSDNRQALFDSSVKVTVTLNPNKRAEIGGRECRILNAIPTFLRGPLWRFFYNLLRCGSTPNAGSNVTYTLDSIVMRAAWAPLVAFDSPNNFLDSPRDAGVGSVSNAVAIAGFSEAATQNDVFATARTGTATVFPTSFANLRFSLRDPNLLDGFLKISKLSISARMRKPSSVNTNDRVDFVLKTHTGVWCRKQVRMTEIIDNQVTFREWVPNSNYSDLKDGQSKPTCTQGGDPSKPVINLDTGEVVTYKKRDGTEALTTASFLDVEIVMANTGVDRTFQIDDAGFSAEADGYQRPPDPFTVTWNPLIPNADTTPRQGDATFNVFGSVSVPNNDVRVIWNWDNSNSSGVVVGGVELVKSAGPLGFPLFNGGSVPADKCNPSYKEGCKPALVAAALGSWTTGTWPAAATATPKEQPDPLASTGDTRPPNRNILVVSCIVDDSGTPGVVTDDKLVRKAEAEATIIDIDGRVAAVGKTVKVTRWRRLPPEEVAFGAEATTKPCTAG